MPSFYLSPSRIARAFYHDCERYLRYHATPKKERKAEGIPQIPFSHSPVTAAILDRGFDWEEEIIRKKLKGQVRIAKGKGAITERSFDTAESLKVLASLNEGEAIYQPTLSVPSQFLTRYGIDPTLCNFPECRPDLVMKVKTEDGRAAYRIIDIKASDALKASHRIQVTLYALILRDLFASKKMSVSVDLDVGGIWLYGQNEPQIFDLRASTGVTERFLESRLPDILSKPISEIPWHLYFRCEWCEYFGACRKEADECSSVSLIPRLTVGGRRYLREASWAKGVPVNTLGDLEKMMKRKDVDEILDACGSLRGQRERLKNTLNAMKEAKVVAQGSSSIAMPVHEDVRIMLNLQAEPLSGSIYAAGFRRFKGKDVYPTTLNEQVFVAKKAEDCEQVRDRFLTTLHDEMKTLDAWNRPRDWWGQKSLQVYVYDQFEVDLFQQMLREALDVPKLAPIALRLMFHFQDSSLSDKDKHPEVEVNFPIIVLTHVLGRLLALPVPLSFRLPEVHEALAAGGDKFHLTPKDDDLFWSPISNAMKSDAIAMVWDGKKPEAVGWVEKQLGLRLRAADNIVESIRKEVGDRLFAWPPKFTFPGAQDYQHPEFSRLAFIVRYESVMQALEIRESRTQPWAERERSCASIRLRCMGGDRFKVLGNVPEGQLEENSFPNRLVVPAGEDGERDQMAYDDYHYRGAFWSPKKGHARIAAVPEVSSDPATGLVKSVRLDITYSKSDKPYRKDDEVVLHDRFTEFTADNILARLKELDSQPDSDLLRLIKSPTKFAQPLSGKSVWVATARKLSDESNFTPSQKKAFRHILSNRLTLVWGPPGTGKTHFLARAILCLAKAHQRHSHPLRIGVTAFTHAAIENLLAEIKKQIGNFGLDEHLHLNKLKTINSQTGEGLDVLDEDSVSLLSGKALWVVGGTVYSLRKASRNQIDPVDLLIVDEASQMKFGELALGMMPLAKGARLVMAGDDMQLPPIIKGAYPVPEDSLPGLHESVFSWLRNRGGEPYTHQLQENWRMNETLSRFAAETIYGPAFNPATPEIASQRITLLPSPKVAAKDAKISTWRDWMLSPGHPLVVAILEGVQATIENPLEAAMTADLAVALRQRLLPAGRKSAHPDTEQGDRKFWREQLFIVSPHRDHIAGIQRELAALRPWQSTPFVDTVDKMQGQQATSVIVSYGVSDVETAMGEAEFIYSLNRLNVAVTRAKAKCIVFLSRPLLDPSFDLQENEKASKGLGHMLALIDYCRRNGDEKTFDLDFLSGGKGKRLVAYRARS